ncbi:MAG TPA: L,D-transpeptidase family protein, partial [Sphingomicrobium sp.]|nr:L,D-transpeptidase family protein [Sphingomicrobium sp.]
MRFPLLFASAAALALAACGNTAADNGGANQSAAGDLSQVDDKSLEEQVTAALDDAPKHGLTKDLFLKGELPADEGRRRQALLNAAKDYASALASGKTDPAKLRDVYTVPRPKVDIDSGLSKALSENKYREWVNSLAPQTDEYRALGEAFAALVNRSPDLPDDDIPGGGTIDKGDSDERLPLIVRNLKAQGYLPTGEQQGETQTQGLDGTRYTPAIAQAVARFQADSGLKPDGVIGSGTIEALNQGPRDRARTLAVAMERLRWLERNPPATRIDVNTAGTYLDYYRDGQHADRRKVVTGQPGWETPQLGSPIYQLVANPTWTVPDSIVEDEISKKSGSWLAANNFVRKDGRYVQQPGPKNALGEVKFDMKNDHAIYLHDTPAKALFSQDERHRSHGCVRVEGALDFARTLAEADGVLDKFDKAMATGEETFVDLNTEIPVRLMYHTAYLGDDGRIHYAEDAYGWDNDIATALG